MKNYKLYISVLPGLFLLIILNSATTWASLVNIATLSPEQALDETCLDAMSIPNVTEVTIDPLGWHQDARFDLYGLHVTVRIMSNDIHIDTLHVYKEKNDIDNCLYTFSQHNYDGLGIPDGHGFYAYFSDTAH